MASRLPMILVVAACLLAVCVVGLARTAVEASPTPVSPTLLYTVAKRYEPLAWMQGRDRFGSGATILVHDEKGNHPLVPSFSASADAAVSFDGQRVLFAGKQNTEEPWQIWEMPLAGGAPRRITSGHEDCVRPLYLPADRVAYAHRDAGRFVIETTDLAGGRPLPLTYGPGNFVPTDVLHDGRILFEAAYPLGADSVTEIYTVYSDGSGVESYRCDHEALHHSSRQVTSGDVVFVSSRGLARFTSARAQQVQISAPAGEYAGGVVETQTGDWLVPWRAEANAPYQLMQWTPGSTVLRPEIVDQNLNTVEPVIVRERAVPNRHPSGLHDWPNATLLCLNAYTSKYQFAAGSIHSVRLYGRDDRGNPVPLGTAPVERDGSFFLQVPTERPLQVELLDEAGKTLKRESGYFWMRRGEQRGCVGCHAGPESSPENAVPMILWKSTTPADMTGTTAQNATGGR